MPPTFDPSQPYSIIVGPGGAAPGQGAPGPGQGTPQSPSLQDWDPTQVNSALVGDDYMHQFPAEIQAAMKNYMSGGTMPTGNPRLNGITTFAKMYAQKYAQDIGNPDLADDALYPARRKMRADLVASANNTMGGIIANGKSAFDHLATLSGNYANLGNYNGPSLMPGLATEGANLATNLISNSAIRAKMTAINDNAVKYGEEATKFYAGSGGGEAERLMALKNINPLTATSNDMAAFLQTEKDLMMARLQEKADQISGSLGSDYLARHPVMTPQLQNSLGTIDANIARLRGQSAQGSPQASPQSAASPFPEGQMAINRQTGQRIMFRGGGWQPMQ